MAEAFVRTMRRDYVRVSPVPDAASVLRQLPGWIEDYNELHPHRALGYRSPREFIARSTQKAPSGLKGQQDAPASFEGLRVEEES
jgi:putative transposase